MHHKMLNLISVFWCCVLWTQYGKVISFETAANFVTAQGIVNGDTLLIKGHCVNSSDINFLMANRNISKIHVFVANTFYADADLQLNGISELRILASTWNITRQASFDLTGLNGQFMQSEMIKGAAGRSGNAGMNGGSFFALANEIINGERLTVTSNGGNGGDGQDAAPSEDTYVTFNEDSDIGDSGWFSNADLRNFYEKYFNDRGYDPDIGGIDDYTSFYAVFAMDKRASLKVRLHPRKCCGTTGAGGAGGIGGRNGNFVFKYVGSPYVNSKPVSTPKFTGNDGSVGKMGKDATACKSLALDIRIDAELKKVVFIYLPLHHSFSSRFTVLNHVDSSKCSPVYVKSEETINVEPEPIEMESVSHVVRYKRFLLENMKNVSLTAIAERAYKAIDEHREINDEYSLNAFVLEACELEKHYFELKKSIDVVALYERLSERVNRLKLRVQRVQTDDDELALSRLQMILSEKSSDVKRDYNLIVNVSGYTESAVSYIEIKTKYAATPLNVTDVELRNSLDQLQFGVNANYILDTYYYVIDAFRLNYFPFAVDYLETLQLPTSYTAYKDLNATSLAATNKLNTLGQIIDELVSSNSLQSVAIKIAIAESDPGSAFYVWKNEDFRDEIENLFYGEKITLLANVKKSKNQFNAFKFNTIDLVIRLSQPTQQLSNDLNDILQSFEVTLNHTGASAIRCNDKFYQMTSKPMLILTSFAKDQSQVPRSRTLVYDMLHDSHPFLSPYTLWEIQLETVWENFYEKRKRNEDKFSNLRQFIGLVDVELHGTGKYIEENAPICESENLTKFYPLKEN